MKYLVINASPEKTGMTSKLCGRFVETAKKEGEVKELALHDEPPEYCKGTSPKPKNLSIYQEAVLECDALFIATPTYWFNMPSILKAFIESLDQIELDLWRRPRTLGLVVYAPEGGEFGTAAPIVLALNHMNFSLVDNGYVYYRGVEKDDWAWDDLQLMPERMKKLIGNRAED